MKKLILALSLVASNAFAGYECILELAHSEDLHTTVAVKTIKASEKDMRSEMIKEFFVESRKGKKVISLDVNAFMDGWEGEEEATIAVFRRTKKGLSLISEKVSLRGNEKDTLWFDAYKLEIDCTIN